MTERKLLSKFLKLVKSHGLPIYVYKDRDTFGGHKKPCDVWFIVRGRAVCIEFKQYGKKLSDNQRDELQKIAGVGGRVFVGIFHPFGICFTDIYNNAIYGVTWEDLKTPRMVEKLFHNFID